MIIGVISDTHVSSLRELPDQLIETLAQVDLVIHAGDFTEKAVVDELARLNDVKAVCGNMDSAEIRRVLPSKELFQAGGKSIGLTHGAGGSGGIRERVSRMFDRPDIIIYGHSHTPDNDYIHGTLLFNPGAAGRSFGLLTIEDEVKARIVEL